MRTTVGCGLFFLVFLLAAEPVSAEIIGGSVLRSPPQYQSNSFLVGLSGSKEEAYPFHVIPGNDWLLDDLEVPLYHFEGMAGDSAEFSICSDVSGQPGSQVATFVVSNITTEQRIYSITPSFVAGPLQGDTIYWLVGSNNAVGQVNWNMDTSTGAFTLGLSRGWGRLGCSVRRQYLGVRHRGLCRARAFGHCSAGRRRRRFAGLRLAKAA